jgi:hypothetical protein
MGRKRQKNAVDLSTDGLSPAMLIQKRDLSFLYPLLLGAIAFLLLLDSNPSIHLILAGY